MSTKGKYRAGFVALVGQPNAGKSTLLNALLDEKVSIVSDKPQTTRARVTGILTREDAQIVFVDSPGTLKSTSGINKFLQEEVADVMARADVVCALLAADASEASVKELVQLLQESKKPWVALITKIDLLGSGTRTPKFFNFLMEQGVPFVSISTLKRKDEAIEELLQRVIPLLPEAPAPLYDDELYTTQTIRQLAAEFIREACFERLRQEIPYGLAVRINEFDEEGPVVRVRAELLLDKANHKPIVIGAKGQTLKSIGMEARKHIERVVDRQVFLELHVNVRENWTKNPRIMKELGYVVAKD
ncbi:MAG TPA: GTPase Era [Bdellovibrionales bacterium]|nr:GTPase Era [Bdellovibrionales bacterium]